MNEIEYRTKHSQNWRRFLETGLGKNHLLFRSEWCVMVGLCETAGWVGGNVIRWAEAHEREIADCEETND